jgi:hypothetical protein
LASGLGWPSLSDRAEKQRERDNRHYGRPFCELYRKSLHDVFSFAASFALDQLASFFSVQLVSTGGFAKAPGSVTLTRATKGR